MDIKDLEYTYPQRLVALKPTEPCRVLFMDNAAPIEIELCAAFDCIESEDLIIINNSGVKACRIFCKDLEFLFLNKRSEYEWEVLFKSAKFKVGDKLDLPGGVVGELLQKDRSQLIKVDQDLDLRYFAQYGELAIPPYIQKLRKSRHAIKDDINWYQLDWKKNENSLAAPTASLHFSEKDLAALKVRGVIVEEVSLDIGLGTFLPLEEKNIKKGKLHKESFFVSGKTKEALIRAKKNKKRIWALGTTALRAVESCLFNDGDETGETELFITPGYKFKWVSGLFTNFHQPGSSLLALVMAFYGIKGTKLAYKFAVENEFRLFSYGDLSIWKK